MRARAPPTSRVKITSLSEKRNKARNSVFVKIPQALAVPSATPIPSHDGAYRGPVGNKSECGKTPEMTGEGKTRNPSQVSANLKIRSLER